jgi:hypothetical protein
MTSKILAKSSKAKGVFCLKPYNIGTHLKGIETSFQVVPLFLDSFHFWASYPPFIKIPSVFKGLTEFVKNRENKTLVKISQFTLFQMLFSNKIQKCLPLHFSKSKS